MLLSCCRFRPRKLKPQLKLVAKMRKENDQPLNSTAAAAPPPPPLPAIKSKHNKVALWSLSSGVSTLRLQAFWFWPHGIARIHVGEKSTMSQPSAESQVLSLCSTIGVSASAVDAALVSRLVEVLKSEGSDVRRFVCCRRA